MLVLADSITHPTADVNVFIEHFPTNCDLAHACGAETFPMGIITRHQSLIQTISHQYYPAMFFYHVGSSSGDAVIQKPKTINIIFRGIAAKRILIAEIAENAPNNYRFCNYHMILRILIGASQST